MAHARKLQVPRPLRAACHSNSTHRAATREKELVSGEHIINVERFKNRSLRNGDDFVGLWEQVVRDLDEIQQFDAAMAYTFASILRQAANEFWRKQDQEWGSGPSSRSISRLNFRDRTIHAGRDPRDDEPPPTAA